MRAELSESDRLLGFSVRLTNVSAIRRDVEGFHEVGFGDVAVHDIVQAMALCDDFNRLAEGLGIDPEEDPVGPPSGELPNTPEKRS